MVEQIEWEPLVPSLLNLLDKYEIDSEEVTYPISVNIFNGVEMPHSVILVMVDTIYDERQSDITAAQGNAVLSGSTLGRLDLTPSC